MYPEIGEVADTVRSYLDGRPANLINGPDGEACRPCDVTFPLSAEVISQFTGEQK